MARFFAVEALEVQVDVVHLLGGGRRLRSF